MKPGRKTPVAAEPLDFKGWPRDRAKRRMRFIKDYVLTPKGVGALAPLRLRVWQQAIITGAYASGIRTALVSLPRANGKTALAGQAQFAFHFGRRADRRATNTPHPSPTPSAGPAGRQRSAQLQAADAPGEEEMTPQTGQLTASHAGGVPHTRDLDTRSGHESER